MKRLYIKPIFEFEEVEALCNEPGAGFGAESQGGDFGDSAAKKGSVNFDDEESLIESQSKSDSNPGTFIWDDEF